MSLEKFVDVSKKKLEAELCGLVLKEGEKNRLHETCIKYDIPITYPELFEDNTHYSLWGISKTGIGLVGTIIMNYLSQNKGIIFHSLNELESHLKGE